MRIKWRKKRKNAEAAEKRAEKKKENNNQKTKKVAVQNPVACGNKKAQSSKKRQSDKENAQPEASQTTAIQTREDSSSQRTRFHRLVKPIHPLNRRKVIHLEFEERQHLQFIYYYCVRNCVNCNPKKKYLPCDNYSVVPLSL